MLLRRRSKIKRWNRGLPEFLTLPTAHTTDILRLGLETTDDVFKHKKNISRAQRDSICIFSDGTAIRASVAANKRATIVTTATHTVNPSCGRTG
jgi:hypothetical protein